MNSITREKILKRVRKRVAIVSISASTVRNQGAVGVVDRARKYLQDELDLTALENIVTASDYQQWLNEKTKDLSNSFNGGAKGNWGAARKSINIFLVECLLNKILSEEYALEGLAKFMETALDNNAAEEIKKRSMLLGIKCQGIWKSIKSLNFENSALFQECALKLAEKEGIPRGYFDLWLWRSDSDDTLEQ